VQGRHITVLYDLDSLSSHWHPPITHYITSLLITKIHQTFRPADNVPGAFPPTKKARVESTYADNAFASLIMKCGIEVDDSGGEETNDLNRMFTSSRPLNGFVDSLSQSLGRDNVKISAFIEGTSFLYN
jgi:hypothetical protein